MQGNIPTAKHEARTSCKIVGLVESIGVNLSSCSRGAEQQTIPRLARKTRNPSELRRGLIVARFHSCVPSAKSARLFRRGAAAGKLRHDCRRKTHGILGAREMQE